MTAALPAAAVAPEKGAFSFVSIDTLLRSETNPRKHFDEQKLAELAKTIREHGVLEPILARPHPDKAKAAAGKLEIVAGERRWRAAGIAMIPEVSVIVRPLTDKQALEIQTIENAQREDLHPLEQADGYERLIKEFGYTPEKIADAIGKSRAHVFQIRKLKDLSPKMREAFVDGQMDTTLATVVARIPGATLQDSAWQKLKAEFRNGFSFRVAAEFLRKNFMLDLMRAPFNVNDEKLVEKAGACGTCPKRTGAQPDLFPDVKNGNVCTDPVCFHAKRAASQLKEIKTLEDKGVAVITGPAAKKILPYDGSRPAAYNGYANPDEKCYEDSKGRTYRQLAKEADLDPVKLQNPHTGALHDVIPVQALKAALQKTSITLGGPRHSPSAARADAARRATERRIRLEAVVRRKIFEKTVEYSKGKLGKAELAALAAGYFTDIWHEFRKKILQAWGWDKISPHGDGIRKKLATLSEKDLARFLIGLSIVKGCSPNAGSGYKELLAAAKRAGLKPDAIRRDLVNAAKEKNKPKPKAKPKPKTKIKARRFRPVADFMRPFQPDAVLAALIGDKPIARTEVTKKLWGYIKRKGLQDKKNRRLINTDDKLRPILNGKKQLSMFEMTKAVSRHLKPIKTPARAIKRKPANAKRIDSLEAVRRRNTSERMKKVHATRRAKAPAKKKPDALADVPLNKSAINPASAWPFPTGRKP